MKRKLFCLFASTAMLFSLAACNPKEENKDTNLNFDFGFAEHPKCLKTGTLDLNPEKKTGYIWSVDNKSIATIDNEGILSGISKGDVKATVKDGDKFSEIMAKVEDFADEIPDDKILKNLDYPDPEFYRNGQKVVVQNPETTLKYDLYLPTNFDPSQRQKIILYLYGGAWCIGNKDIEDEAVTLGKHYAAAGYVFASMNYSEFELGIHSMEEMSDWIKMMELVVNLAKNEVQDTDFFMMRAEIFSCIKAIRDKLVELGCSANKLEMALSGNSAGGHLALFTGYSTTVNPNNFTEPDTVTEQVKPIKSAIPIKFLFPSVAPVDFHVDTWATGTQFSQLKSIFYTILTIGLGEVTTEADITPDDNGHLPCEGRVQSISPASYINEASLPTLCLYGGNEEGTKDDVIGPAHKFIIEEALTKNHVDHKVIINNKAGHSVRWKESEEKDNRNAPEMKEFMEGFLNFSNTYFND